MQVLLRMQRPDPGPWPHGSLAPPRLHLITDRFRGFTSFTMIVYMFLRGFFAVFLTPTNVSESIHIFPNFSTLSTPPLLFSTYPILPDSDSEVLYSVSTYTFLSCLTCHANRKHPWPPTHVTHPAGHPPGTPWPFLAHYPSPGSATRPAFPPPTRSTSRPCPSP